MAHKSFSIRKVVKICFWVVGISLVLALIFNFRFLPASKRPVITVSPEVSWVTSPLRPNGDVDYVAKLNEGYRRPVEVNAFADLCRIIGPPKDSTFDFSRFCRELGMEQLPASGVYLVEFDPDGTRTDGQLTMEVPFGPGEFPEVERWFAANEHHLLAVRKALEKPEHFSPYIGEVLMAVQMPYVARQSSVARSLARSSMLRLGRGDISGAIDDQIAIVRLGRNVSRQGTLIELMVGRAIHQIGIDALAQTVFFRETSAEQLASLQTFLHSIPPIETLDVEKLQNERMMALDIVQFSGRFGFGTLSADEIGDEGSRLTMQDLLLLSTTDLDYACRQINETYDRLELVLAPEDYSGRIKACSEFSEYVNRLADDALTTRSKVISILGGRAQRGRRLGKIFAGLTSFEVAPQVTQDFLAEAKLRGLLTSIALQQHQRKFGNFPEDLEKLVPEFIETVPLDPFIDQPLTYRQHGENSFVLYSLGPNLADGGGTGSSSLNSFNDDVTIVPSVHTPQQWLDRN